MKIHVLTDNHAGSMTSAEHGLSYLIEMNGNQVLFDTGQSCLFMDNAARMHLDLSYVNAKVLSHGHFDHGNGFMHLPGGKLFCHPGVFAKRYRKVDNSYIGLNEDKVFFENSFDLQLADKPCKIAENVLFLGEIPRNTDFEANETSFVFENGQPDFVLDDSGLAIMLPQGLFVILGCSHAGVVNILEHAKTSTGVERIYGVMGGFHLKKRNKQTLATIEYLESEQPRYVFPSHCTDLPALAAFLERFDISQVKTGMTMEF